MKTNVLMAIAIAAATTLAVTAQPQNVRPYSGQNPMEVRRVIRPEGLVSPERNLDDKQREEISKIRTEQIKERTQTRNLLNEKRAKLETLQTVEKPDMKEINKVIDEIAALQAQQMKAQAAGRQKVRSLLTDEQRTYYDAQASNMGNMDNMRTRLYLNNNRFARPEIERSQRAVQPERPQRMERQQR